jgi:rhodanese-related sulfurtransferase
MKTISILVLLMLLSSQNSLAATPNCKDDKNYPEIEKSELNTLVQKKSVFVVDVNSKESFKKSHVPTAIHYGEVKNEFASKLPTDKNALIVAYCGGPACTAWKKAAMEACANGYTNIKHFKGGISGWNAKI